MWIQLTFKPKRKLQAKKETDDQREVGSAKRQKLITDFLMTADGDKPDDDKPEKKTRWQNLNLKQKLALKMESQIERESQIRTLIKKGRK